MNNKPDDFMNKIFDLCSNIYFGPDRAMYRMISTGSNDLSMPKIWKRLIAQEINQDLIYMWYTAPGGMAAARNFVKMYHEILATKGAMFISKNRDACMTLGACQATRILFDYLIKEKNIKQVTILGYSYSLFERECRRCNLVYRELISKEKNRNLPNVKEVIDNDISTELFVLSLPTNPTGEIWNQADFEKFLHFIKQTRSLLLLDIVGYSPISERNNLLFDYAIRKIEVDKQVYIINSFSKSDSVPAFRLGYLFGHGDLYKFSSSYQFDDMMNGPIFPLLPMLFTLQARIIYMNRKYKWNIDEKMHKIITFNLLKESFALLSKRWEKRIYKLFCGSNFDRYYRNYVTEQLRNEKIILYNYNYMLKVLKNEIEEFIKMESGFNIIVKLKGTESFKEYDFCEKLLNHNGLSVLTESCFTIMQRNSNSFWIRISLAKAKKYFRESILNLKSFLNMIEDDKKKDF